MFLKNMLLALMIALGYEMVLKAGRLLVPGWFNSPFMHSLTPLLSILVSLIILLFLISFYQEEKGYKPIGNMVKILIVLFVLNFIFKLAVVRDALGYQSARLTGEIFSLITVALMFSLLIFFIHRLPAENVLLKQATLFLLFMFGIGIIKNIFSMYVFGRFVLSGVTMEFSDWFYQMMMVIFFLTHLSLIYFLFRYYQFKFQTLKA